MNQKKVEVVLRSRKAGHNYLIKGNGEMILHDELVNEKSQVAIFHAKHYSQDAVENWYTVNLWTGLFISGGSTRKKCLDEFYERMPAYVSMLNNPERIEYFRKEHEEFEKVKTGN